MARSDQSATAVRYHVRYQVLGPLAVLADGAPVDIGSSRQRIVLAALLLDANRVVPRDRLIDALWEDDPPATASSQIQICVSALRRKLAACGAADVIVTRPPGYLIRTAVEELDAREFELLVAAGRKTAADGRPGEAARQFRSALSLWQGPALAGVASDVIQVAATRLNEDRIAILEECIGLELELGRHHDLVGELSELVAEHPLRERLRAQHMLALYRDGRQADALSSFRAARDVLLEDLGLEPGQELRDLEQAILVNDPSLRPAAATPARRDQAASATVPMIPRQLPAAISDFVAREGALAKIRALLTPPADGPEGPAARRRHVEVVVITGRSGVGKTALALYAAQELCELYPDGQLFAQLESGSSEPASPAHALEAFLRALGVSQSGPPAGVQALAQTYRSRLAGRRVLVVLDAAVSAAQVLPLLPGDPSCAVIITSRSRLPRLDGARRIEVGVLDEGDGVELLNRVIGEDRVRHEQEAAAQLVRLCGGLPVALRIAAAKLAARPHWVISRMAARLEDEAQRLDELVLEDHAHGDAGIRASISLSFESLGPEAQRLMRRLAILGPTDFSYWVGAPLLGRDVLDVMELMEQLVEARLVDVRMLEDRSIRLQVHELIRVYALERLLADEPAAERTAALGRVLGCWLFLAREAHRREYGGDFTVLHGSADVWELPETVVSDLLDSPLSWFRSERTALVAAIFKAAQAGLSELCWDLAMTSSTHFESGPFFDDWRQSCGVALEAVRRAGNRRGEAALLASLGALALAEHGLDDAVRYLEPAARIFREVEEPHGWALATRNLAYVDRLRGSYDQALSRYAEALAALRAAGDRIAEAHVLSNMAHIYLDRRQHQAAEDLLGEALGICAAVGVRRVAAQVTHRLGELRLSRGDYLGAEAAFESVQLAVMEGSDLVGQAYALYGLGVARIGRERYALAEADLRRALELSAECGDRLIHGRILLALAQLPGAAAAPAVAVDGVAAALAAFREVGSALWQARALATLGRLHEGAGRPAAAERAWREGVDLIGDSDCELRGTLLAGLARVSAR